MTKNYWPARGPFDPRITEHLCDYWESRTTHPVTWRNLFPTPAGVNRPFTGHSSLFLLSLSDHVDRQDLALPRGVPQSGAPPRTIPSLYSVPR